MAVLHLAPSDEMRQALLQRIANDLRAAETVLSRNDSLWECCWVFFDRQEPGALYGPTPFAHKICDWGERRSWQNSKCQHLHHHMEIFLA